MQTFKLIVKHELFCIVRLHIFIRKLLILYTTLLQFDILWKIFFYDHNYISSVNRLYQTILD